MDTSHRNAGWRRLLLVVVALACVSLGYGVWSQRYLGGARWRQAQADHVREAVFGWQIARHRKDGETCFLTIQGQNATETATFVTTHFRGCSYIEPLTDNPARATPSPLRENTPTINGFVDARTGKPALNFWIHNVVWKSDTRADVAGGGAAAMGSGSEGIFSVVWGGTHWAVTGYKIGVEF